MFVPTADVDYTSVVIGVITFILGGGLAGAIVAARKGGAEATSIITNAALVVNKELRDEVGRLVNVVKAEREASDDYRRKLVAATAEVDQLRGRVHALVLEVQDLEGRLDEVGH